MTAFGTYTAPSRVERDGRLVCFEGETMTAEEAVRRGLLDCEENVACGPFLETKAELKKYAESLGLTVPKSYNRTQIEALIIEETGALGTDPATLSLAKGEAGTATVENAIGTPSVKTCPGCITAEISGTTLTVTPDSDAPAGDYSVKLQDDSLGKQTADVAVTVEPSTDALFTSFTFTGVASVTDRDDAAGTISVEVPADTDVTKLKAHFEASGFASVGIGTAPQVSGETENDFTSPVTYTVTAEDGETTKDYAVTVTLAAGEGE